LKEARKLRRFLGNKRGISTIIGAAFFVVIILLALAVMSWQAMRFNAYMQTVGDSEQKQWERQSESIAIVSVLTTSANGLNVTIRNMGPVTAHLVTMYVTEYDASGKVTSRQRNYDLRSYMYYVNPGNATKNIGTFYTLNSNVQYGYSVRIVTERGTSSVYYFTKSLEYSYYSAGSMKIKYVGQYNSASRSDSDPNGWVNPWIQWAVLNSSAYGKTTIYVEAAFTNNMGFDLTGTNALNVGNITFMSAYNVTDKTVFMGGKLSTSLSISAGQTQFAQFQINQFSSILKGGTLNYLPWTFNGLASLSTSTTAPKFYCATFAVDGLLLTS
jgi:hypothetical protein